MPTLKYWDSELAAYVSLSGGSGFDEVTADARYVNLDGDTMTAPLVLPGNPSTALQAAPKQYVDSKVPLVLGPEDPVPGGTPAGTIIVRTVT